MKVFSIKLICLLFLLGIPVLGISASGEFLINTYTTGDQRESKVAMDSAGNFVITWQSMNQDGSGDGVYARRFDSAANPLGSEFQVNTYTDDAQYWPSVAMDSTGNFVIVWMSNGQDGYSDIFAQRFDSNGNKVGHEFLVNTYTDGFQDEPYAAMDNDGDFVITWISYNQVGYCDIFAQRFDSNGNKVGSEFQVNTYTDGFQWFQSAAMDNTGNFVITWASDGQDGSNFGIYAQRYGSNGNPVGSEFRVNTYTNDMQYCPSIVMDSTGNFIIAWDSTGQDGDGWGVYAQRYNNNGNPIGSEFQINTYTDSFQLNTSIALDNSGNFIITWYSYVQDGDGYGIFAQKYDSNANPMGSEFQVNIYTQGDQTRPSVAMDSDGDFVIVWKSKNQFSGNSGLDIYARFYKVSTPTPTPTKTATIPPSPTKTLTPTPSSTFTSTPWDAFPTLTEGIVEPESGLPDTTFEFTVYYNDADGGSPAVSKIYINQAAKDMSFKSGNTWDGLYHLEITGNEISLGKNNFYFIFVDDEGNTVRYPTGGFLDGPYVNSGITPTPTITKTPTQTPTPTEELLIEWGLGIAPEKSSYKSGDRFNLLLDVKTPSEPMYADVYWVLLQYSTGNLYCAPLWTTQIMPVLENFLIPANVDVNDTILFGFRIPQDSPPLRTPGQYTFAIGATKPGTIEWVSNIANVSLFIAE